MMDDMKMEGGKGMMCKCSHHKVMPILVIVFGLLFLGGALEWVSPMTVMVTWPILVIIGGVMKLSGGMCKCC